MWKSLARVLLACQPARQAFIRLRIAVGEHQLETGMRATNAANVSRNMPTGIWYTKGVGERSGNEAAADMAATEEERKASAPQLHLPHAVCRGTVKL
jgi:hypothetical protein